MKKIATLTLIGVLCAAPALALDGKDDRDMEKSQDLRASPNEAASSLSLDPIDEAQTTTDAPRSDWVGTPR